MDGRLESEDLVPVRALSERSARRRERPAQWPTPRFPAVMPLAAALALSAACSAPSMVPSPRPPTPATPVGTGLSHFGLSVAEVLAYLEQHTMECHGPAEPFADSREWLCVQDDDVSTNTVRVIGDAAGVSQVVGVSEGLSPDDAISFLLGVVMATVVPNAESEGLMYQAVSQPRAAGTWALQSASVELQAHSEARAVILNLPQHAPR